jgi:hypothetical protein
MDRSVHRNEHTFKKGQCGNPNGKPVTKIHKEVANLAKMAINDLPTYYKVLMEKVQNGDTRAMALFQDLIPKRFKAESFKIIQDTTTIDTQIDSLRKGLGLIEDHDISSATTILKALSSTKIAEVEAQTEADVIEDRKAMYAKIDQGLEMLDKLEQKAEE